MKNKLLLFLLVCNYFTSNLIASNVKVKLNVFRENSEFINAVNYNDSIKRQNKISKTAKTTAIIPPPLVTAGSSCKEITEPTVQVYITASGRSGDIIEWYDSQNSTTILHKGSIYGPVISKTTTFYVQTRSGVDNSVRVPVVASVYTSPPSVTLTASPENSVDSPLCFGTPTTFTAVGGADLFEFSVDGVVVQAMSTNRTFITNTLTNGQVVSVRTRYSVNFDGTITETAWGTGAMEDNVLSASLSPSAVDGYINSIKISPTENELVFGIAGKLNNNRSLLLFLDTKPGGFNVSNYGDEPLSGAPLVKAFNLFNNNPSTFDRDFYADYCLAISTDDGGTNYFADIIELKTGVSTKVHLGSASLGNPSSSMGVNTGNSGTTDYDLGFEVAVLKSIIGYTEGELSFFALTMQDDSAMNYNVTNSFLSPELSSTVDYGSGAINYNDEDTNPVVVSANAFMPCYKAASRSVVIVPQPTIATVGTNQTVCTLVSNPLGGNTPVVGTGVWAKKAGPGSVVFSNSTSGSSTATVSVEGTYIFTWTISNSICTPSTADITVEFHNPPVIPTASVIQPSCAIPTGTISMVAQSGVTYSLDGINFFSSNTFTGLAPNSYTLYVRSTSNTSCVTPSSSVIVVNPVPTPPAVPTMASVVQPTCSIPSGTISIATQTGVEYSLNGTTYQPSNIFAGLAPNSYAMYVRKTSDNSCVTSSSSTITINTIPTPPAVPTVASVVQPTCSIPSGTISITTQSGVEYSLNGINFQGSNSFAGLASGNYTLYVRKISDNSCISTSPTATTINSIPIVLVPTTSSIIQPTCGTPSGTIAITTQSGVEYSLNGTNFQASNTFAGLTPGNYILYVRSTTDNTCITPSATAITINAIPTPPVVPTMANVVQPTCSIPSGTISIATQTGVEYSLNGTTYQPSNIFTGLTPNSYTMYVRNISDNSCVTSSSSTITINAIPTPPAVPTITSIVQPTCSISSGTITITTQSGVEYSLNGTTYQLSNTFTGLASGNYTLYVRNISDNSCISTSPTATTINPIPVVPVPTTTSIIQPTCGTPSGTIAITTQSGVEYSLNGTNFQASNTFAGLTPGNYILYVRSTTDNTCITPSATAITINAIPTPPAVPTMFSVVQPTCGTLSGTITITAQSGVEYSLNGTTYQSSNTFAGLTPNSYTLYVRRIADNTCQAQGSSSVVIDPLPALPSTPTLASITQPSCLQSTGQFIFATQANVQYSIGGAYQDSPVFSNVFPGTYRLSVRFINSTSCITLGAEQTINPVPVPIQFESTGDCVDKEYILTASPLLGSYDSNTVDYQWKDNLGNAIGTNSNILNVSDVLASLQGDVVFPLNFSLTISSGSTACVTTENVVIESALCNIQKGISPDGNGSNDYFDLSLMDVKKLEIFDRYGIPVYSKSDYTMEWKGQSNNGNELPSATYYYVIEFNNGSSKAKTGWIYLIREK